MQEFRPNDTISNRYKVLRKLGAGAMGSVYLCEDSVENNIKVALKVLVSDELEDQDIWAKGEYEALTRLRHPNLAKVYNFGRIGDSKDYFIVSEFIKGIDLYSATEYLNYDELVDIIVQICRALEYIHSQGYVHFDIKPDNILVTRYKTVGIKEGSKVQYNEADLASSKRAAFSTPHVKLIDFGLAEKITGSFNFAIKGTLNYLAPEILNGQTPDKRADLYSLGVTLYQVTNRDLPFFQEFGQGASTPVTKRSELFGIHMKKHPDFLRNLILRLLEENPDDRFQSAKELIQFINKNSEYRFDLETSETRASYFYSSKLVGRRREMNLLKGYHERIFFPQQASAATAEAEAGAGAPPAAEAPQGGAAEPKVEEGQPAVETSADGDIEDSVVTEGSPTGPDCPALILVSGEMGSGKSRLLEEFEHFLRLRDLSCYPGNCYEGNRKAYQPMVEILRQLVCALGFDSDFYKSYRQDVVKLLPEMRQEKDPAGPGGSGLGAEKEKVYFIDRICQLLIEASRVVPYVVVINNLHWIDEASVGLLENLLLRIAEGRAQGDSIKLMILASIRPEEPIPEGLRDSMEKLKREGQCREVPVRRLKHAQIQEFLRSMLNFTDVQDAFVAKLEEKTGGNPLFIVETLKALEDDGIIRHASDGWVIKGGNYDRVEIPQSMEDLLGKRLQKLDSTKRELLEVLSVLDKPANPKFLQKMKRFAEVSILVELRDLEETGIIMKAFEGGKLHFTITQPKVREILYSKIPEDSRKKYHGEVGSAFLELYRGKEEEILEELAYHYRLSDQDSRALEFAIKAGDWLKRIYANERAFDYYMYVLEKIERKPEQLHLWVDTHQKLGDLCTVMGRYDVAEKSYAALLEEDVRTKLDSGRVVKTFLARGKVFEIQGDYDLALKCFKDARNYLAGFKKDELIIERIQVFNSIGWVYVCMGKYEKAMAISLEALRVIEGGPERIEHALVYNTIGSANYYKGNFREAIEYHRRSLQIKENLENIQEIIGSLNNLGCAFLAASEYGEALEHLRRALKTSEEIGDPYGKAMSLHNFARLHFAVGQADKGWQCLDESLKLSKIYNMRHLNVQNYLVRGKALLEKGEAAKAEGNYFRALTAYTKQANRWGLCTALVQIAELHRVTGNLKEARASIGEARRYAEDLDIHNLEVLALVEEARLQREDGDEGLDAAAKLLEQALAIAEKCEHPELLSEVNYEMGELQVRRRLLREATQYYKKAEEKMREVLENLPEDLRESYQARQRVRFRNWKGSSLVVKKPSGTDEPVIEAVPSATSVPVPASAILREEAPGSGSAEKSLKMVNDLMAALCAGGELREFLGKVLDDILAVLSGETAFFLFLQGESLTVEVGRSAQGKAAGDPEHTICLPLIENACANKRPLFLADMADDMDAAKELEKQGIACSSLAIATFRIETGREGVLYVLNPQLQKGGDEASLWVLKPFLNLASIAYRQLCPEALPAP